MKSLRFSVKTEKCRNKSIKMPKRNKPKREVIDPDFQCTNTNGMVESGKTDNEIRCTNHFKVNTRWHKTNSFILICFDGKGVR